MNIGKSVNSLTSKFNLALRISKPFCGKNVVDVNKIPAAAFSDIESDGYNNSRSLLLREQHGSRLLNFYECQGERMIAIIPKTDLPVAKKIIEPEKLIKLEIPLRTLIDKELELPCHIEKDMVEPTNNIISKQAINILRIRAKKMRLHKRKKHARKYKAMIQKIRRKRASKKEYAFQFRLKRILKVGEDFDAKEMVKAKLKEIHWEKPVTRIRGFQAPDWVIKEELEKQREKKLYNERIEECIQYKNRSS